MMQAARRHVLGMNMAYVKISSNQKGDGGAMNPRPAPVKVTRCCNATKKTAGKPKITSSAARSLYMDKAHLRLARLVRSRPTSKIDMHPHVPNVTGKCKCKEYEVIYRHSKTGDIKAIDKKEVVGWVNEA